jgi:hypothetical protein
MGIKTEVNITTRDRLKMSNTGPSDNLRDINTRQMSARACLEMELKCHIFEGDHLG